MAEPTMIRGIRIGGAALIAASLIAVITPCSAQTTQAIPPQIIPPQTSPPQTAQKPPAPKLTPKKQLSASDPQKDPGTTRLSQPPNPVIPDPRRNVPANIFATFDANQKAQAARVSSWLSSLQTLVGNFVQVGPDGTKVKGDFYIQKPGKVRFEYDAPSPLAIISDGSSMVVRDRSLATQDIYPLSQTPIRFLLSDRIDLMKDTNVVNVTADDMYVSVTIEEKQVLTGTSRLMLMLGAKDGQLKQWTITDPQGYDTTVAIYNLDTTRRVNPDLFKLDDFSRFTPG
jgi:outer membrane lipoprotein-sorting protein